MDFPFLSFPFLPKCLRAGSSAPQLLWLPIHEARMMFCTTFLSAPSEELGRERGAGGTAGTGGGGGGLGPAGCLSSLHCLVLPQEDLFPACGAAEAPQLLEVGASGCRGRDGGCMWESVRRRRSRSASPLPNKSPKSPRSPCAPGTSVRSKLCLK